MYWRLNPVLAAAAALGTSVIAVAEPAEQKLGQVVVTGTRESYVPNTSTAGSRMEIAPRDLPQALTVFDDQVLRDLSPRVLDEIADYVAGVEREAAQANPYAVSFYMRGFNTAGGATTLNGFRDNGFNTPQSAANIERIEFLKGPASVLYGGTGALSGLVNIVTKKPLDEPFHRLDVSAGSFRHLAGSLDSTGPLTSGGRARYRLTAAYDEDGNFVNDTNQRSLFISPYVSVDLGSATTLDVEAIAQDVDRPGREPHFLRDPDFFELPLDVQLGDPTSPDGNGGELTRYSGRTELLHTFGNGIRFRQALYANSVHSDDTTIQPLGYDPATQVLDRRVRAVDEYQRERYSQTELNGENTLAGLGHTWLAGFELGTQNTGYIFRVAPFSSVNIFDPQPGQRQGPLTVPFPGSDSEFRAQALYFQDLISIGSGFKAMLGARADRLKSSIGNRDDAASVQRQRDDAISPRAGLIYQPGERNSYYISWSRSFRPNSGVNATGALFDPQQGEQTEIGLKSNLTESLQFTAAVYEYRRENVLTADPDNVNFSIAVGEQRSRGVELEVLGQLASQWQIVASYGYLDAEVTRDNRLPVGNRLTGVPEHSAALFNKLGLGRWGLPGLSATLGIAYASDRASGIPNDPPGALTAADVDLPSYVKVDGGFVYERSAYEVRLVGRNLTDERIYDGYNSTFQPRAPRSYEVSVGYRF
jgi:iron complex outermembrane recepter protein